MTPGAGRRSRAPSNPTAAQLRAIHELAAMLCGSTATEESVIGQYASDLKPLARLPAEILVPWLEQYGDIFVCPGCGWWCETSEQTAGNGGELVCAECAGN